MKKNITFFVAECMEYPNLGNVFNNIETIENAIALYNSLDGAGLNTGKGIGFNLKTSSLYNGNFGLYENGIIDIETINSVEEYKNNKDIQNAIKILKNVFNTKN